VKRLIALVLSLAAGSAAAQSFPSRSVRLIVPFAPGGGVDVLSRQVAIPLAAALGQPVVVENRPGAGGTIGVDIVAKAAPDGHTLLSGFTGLTTLPWLYKKLPYEPHDITGVTQMVASWYVLVVASKVPASSVKELLAHAKAKQGGLNFGSAGAGTAPHLAMELVKLQMGIEAQHIPYKGDGPLNTALVSGEVDLAIQPIGTVLPYIQSGKIRALGVTGPHPVRVLPGVPAMSSAGVPGYEFASWQGIFAPAKTPREVVARLYRDTGSAINTPDVKDRITSVGWDVIASTPEEFDAKYRAGVTELGRVVKAARIPTLD
jgi:tripartite-type tricarboxylate transporter receptor subunit TctC